MLLSTVLRLQTAEVNVLGDLVVCRGQSILEGKIMRRAYQGLGSHHFILEFTRESWMKPWHRHSTHRSPSGEFGSMLDASGHADKTGRGLISASACLSLEICDLTDLSPLPGHLCSGGLGQCVAQIGFL